VGTVPLGSDDIAGAGSLPQAATVKSMQAAPLRQRPGFADLEVLGSNISRFMPSMVAGRYLALRFETLPPSSERRRGTQSLQISAKSIVLRARSGGRRNA
jgi:hypothetical protein